jgi:hypothetical protein
LPTNRTFAKNAGVVEKRELLKADEEARRWGRNARKNSVERLD